MLFLKSSRMKSVLVFADFAHRWAQFAFKAIILIAQKLYQKDVNKEIFHRVCIWFRGRSRRQAKSTPKAQKET